MWSAKIFGAKVLSNHSTFILSLVRQHGAMDDVTNGLSTANRTANRIQPQRFRLSHWSHGMSWPSWLPRVVDVWHWSLEGIIYLVPRMSQQPEANSFKLRFEWQGTYSLGEKKHPRDSFPLAILAKELQSSEGLKESQSISKAETQFYMQIFNTIWKNQISVKSPLNHQSPSHILFYPFLSSINHGFSDPLVTVTRLHRRCVALIFLPSISMPSASVPRPSRYSRRPTQTSTTSASCPINR